MIDRRERCRACGSLRPLAELLIVRETGRLHRTCYVCRPLAPTLHGAGLPPCFASLHGRDGERIALAVEPTTDDLVQFEQRVRERMSGYPVHPEARVPETRSSVQRHIVLPRGPKSAPRPKDCMPLTPEAA